MEVNKNHLVSIVIPCYNAESYLAECISSVISQKYKNIEIIVVDDGSTDKSIDILIKFDHHVKWVSGPNYGGNVARNRGLGMASGHYIKFLDADDTLSPEILSSEINCISQINNSDSILVISGSLIVAENLTPVGLHWNSELKNMASGSCFNLDLILRNTPPIGSPLYLTRVVKEIGGFNEALSNRQDIDLFIRYVTRGHRPVYSGVFGYYYRQYYSDSRVSISCRKNHVHSELFMLASHMDLINEISDKEIKDALRISTALRAWTFGREVIRKGFPNDALPYFNISKSLGLPNYINGSFFYKIIVVFLGPIKTELLFEKIKSTFIRSVNGK